MFKVSHYAIMAFLALCTALMVTLLIVQDVDDGYTYEEQEDEGWS